MKELQEAPHPQDIYLMSLVEELRTKYIDVEVLRWQRHIVFVYYIDLQFKRLGEKSKFRKECKISRLEIEKCQALGVVPKKIKTLLEL